MTPRRVLLYHPDEAEAYARLVKAPRGAISLDVCSTPEDASARISEAEILYAWKFPPHLLAKARRLCWIQAMGAGVESFLVAQLPPRVIVTRTTGMFGAWMAEYALGWCAWVTQRMEAFREAQRQRAWRALNPEPLHGRTLAIVGLGDIGSAIARAGRALGMRIIGVNRSGKKERGVAAVYRPSAISRALGQADFVVTVLPLTEETRGLIGEAELRAMKPSAWLINIGGGERGGPPKGRGRPQRKGSRDPAFGRVPAKEREDGWGWAPDAVGVGRGATGPPGWVLSASR